MQFSKLTPNLMVRDIAASLNFYQQSLGMERRITVPDKEPFVFVALGGDGIEIFLNKNEDPNPPVSGGISMYIEVTGLDQLLSRIERQNVKIKIPLNETFYGMREFGVLDPDGYLLIFAEPVKK